MKCVRIGVTVNGPIPYRRVNISLTRNLQDNSTKTAQHSQQKQDLSCQRTSPLSVEAYLSHVAEDAPELLRAWKLLDGCQSAQLRQLLLHHKRGQQDGDHCCHPSLECV